MITDNDKTDRYAVFGNPISHSLSPQLHRAFATQTQQNLVYSAELVATEDFDNAVNDFFHSGGKGLNITVPFKQAAFEMAQLLTERARFAGAVNTLYLNNEHTLVGDNTDGAGLIEDILHRLQWVVFNKNILVLGAGGAARGILQPLLEQKPNSLVIANRTLSKALSLTDLFSEELNISACEFNNIPNQAFDIIINATSAGLTGEMPPLPKSIIGNQTRCYDMVYAKEFTPFLEWSNMLGCKNISDGLGMLVGQGAESFLIWRGVKPDIGPVILELQQQLS